MLINAKNAGPLQLELKLQQTAKLFAEPKLQEEWLFLVLFSNILSLKFILSNNFSYITRKFCITINKSIKKKEKTPPFQNPDNQKSPKTNEFQIDHINNLH